MTRHLLLNIDDGCTLLNLEVLLGFVHEFILELYLSSRNYLLGLRIDTPIHIKTFVIPVIIDSSIIHVVLRERSLVFISPFS
jgi:hypothetical protein